VVGIKDDLKGEVPCGFVVLKAGVGREPAEVEREIVTLVRDKIGPVAAFKIAIVVNRLPKTRSGKTLRGTMKKIADDDAWTMPATIDDSAALSEIAAALQRRLSRGPESKLQELRNEVRVNLCGMSLHRPETVVKLGAEGRVPGQRGSASASAAFLRASNPTET